MTLKALLMHSLMGSFFASSSAPALFAHGSSSYDPQYSGYAVLLPMMCTRATCRSCRHVDGGAIWTTAAKPCSGCHAAARRE